ncbi:hypothetical protein R3X27_21115 [Tropicimonas sp. TH_r6]|uniref:hypothetical protein n=1 Tax=Tropicimonas sp. TH_r6 TaxID=3082085 RepID=UPI002952D7A7|nr:hypothetical protein [Tropicimonas sp. TH_r6]MDV7145191.1 hypothetical protein [Tropicimonas sp. TH_r6]
MFRSSVLLLAAMACLVLALVQAEPVSGPAERTAERAAAAGLGVYVALRSVNAALSVAQEVELGGSFGFSANAQPLKVLEPIDDTVERVAGAVFSVALLAGVLAIGVGPVSSLGFLLLAAGLAIQAMRGPLERGAGAVARPLCRAGSLSNMTGLLLAVLLPLSLALGGTLGTVVTQQKWDSAMAQVSAVEAQSKQLLGVQEETGGSEATGVLGQVRGAIEQAGDYGEAVGYYLAEADDLLKASLTLVAIFLLRTLILPLTLVAVMVALLRQMARQ